jgi:hypothetical protein
MAEHNCKLEYLPLFYVRIPGRTRFDYEFYFLRMSGRCIQEARLIF